MCDVKNDCIPVFRLISLTIGAGHQVTALFEIVPVDSDFDLYEPESKYSQKESASGEQNGEYCTVNIRYKEPDGDTSTSSFSFIPAMSQR